MKKYICIRQDEFHNLWGGSKQLAVRDGDFIRGDRLVITEVDKENRRTGRYIETTIDKVTLEVGSCLLTLVF